MKIIKCATLHFQYKFFPLKIVKIIIKPDPSGLSSLQRKIEGKGWELLKYTHFIMLKKLPRKYHRTDVYGIAFGGYLKRLKEWYRK